MLVIYKKFDTYYCTNKDNYFANIQNANQIQRLDDFENAQEIIEYYCQYFNEKPENFIIIDK